MDTAKIWRKAQARMGDFSTVYEKRKAQEIAMLNAPDSPTPSDGGHDILLCQTRKITKFPPFICLVTALREWDWVTWENGPHAAPNGSSHFNEMAYKNDELDFTPRSTHDTQYFWNDPTGRLDCVFELTGALKTVWMAQLERALPMRAVLRKTHIWYIWEIQISFLGLRMRQDWDDIDNILIINTLPNHFSTGLKNRR